MTEATDLDKAHAQLVEQRSSIIEALAKGYERGQTENHIELLLKIQSGERHWRAAVRGSGHSILHNNNSEPKSMHHLFVRRSFAPQNLINLGSLNAGIACPRRLASGLRHLGPK